MIKLINIGNATNTPKYEYYADTEADIESLPANAPMGSSCFVIDTANVYILNSEGEWKKI